MTNTAGLAGRNTIVVGLGMTGLASARKMVELGANVLATDVVESEAVRAAADALAVLGVETYIGELDVARLDGVDLVVVSPGVPPGSPSMHAAREAGVETISEIELASRLCGGTIVAITGTNGKTTTATLVGELLRAAGLDVVVAGNIAPAFVETIKDDDADTYYVIEVSSFQLAAITSFRPHVAAVLNITEDHLNWHETMENYVAAKARIFENQRSDDFAVLNFDDARARSLGADCASTVVPFTRSRLDGVCVADGWIADHRSGQQQRILAANELKIPGSHNVENALAATACALCCGVAHDDIGRALAAFAGVEHRLEKVQAVDGVTYYNDSKATNPEATMKALAAFQHPVIVLLGGRNKGNSFDELARVARERASLAVAFGEAGRDIAASLAAAGVPHEQVATMSDALALAARRAREGDTVVLSPACASFDEFDNFEHRGAVFKALVAEGIWRH